MKWVILILLIGCTSTKTTVIIDSRGSYVKGGDGKGYLTSCVWKRNGIVLSTKFYDTITVSGSGVINYEIILKDDKGNMASENKTITVR